jgi:hypothetical protein
MRQSAVIEWLHDEISDFLGGSTLVSLSNPDNHVSLAEQRDDQVYPFVAIQKIASNPESAGVGSGNLYVDELSYKAGALDAVTYGRDFDFRVEVIPLTDGDAKLRDDLTEDLGDHLSIVARTGAHPNEMGPIDVGEATPDERTDDFVRGDGISLGIEYSRYATDDDPDVAESVELTVSVGDYDDEVSESDDPDAFSETFN